MVTTRLPCGTPAVQTEYKGLSRTRGGGLLAEGGLSFPNGRVHCSWKIRPMGSSLVLAMPYYPVRCQRSLRKPRPLGARALMISATSMVLREDNGYKKLKKHVSQPNE